MSRWDTPILKAYQAGIVSGTSKTSFSPDELITREQIATMLYRAILYIEREKGKEYTVKSADINSYTDKDEVSDWAKTGVGVLVNSKIMNGTAENIISPKDNTTIEMSVLLVYRLYNIEYILNS